ncbi:hypothetical protein XENTR_v10013483 [Xenopus tropicalis]|uniref:F-box only protein 48 n=1 Tax=Xenopus tropicalis TaxID=8364 RepID=A0A6I8RV64_XENTR|nr:F-box only protein 48 [Xenopus tropicalis]KAE8600974.1 hypothetical protein XENTR_v10013483 [Xenopus tropicalis]|eukprot:XP_017949473.1 PREDICTED: F-box only protein 48 [Xenopus tropicalis]
MAEKKNTLDVLPSEMVYKILAYLDLKHLYVAARVCKTWNSVAKEYDILWKKFCLALPDACKERINNYRDSGYSWKETLERTKMDSARERVQQNWLNGRYSQIRSFKELPQNSMCPLDKNTWGEILEAEERRN